MSHYDIAVVGAGIVGAAAALKLQQQGYRVALIDAQQPSLTDDPLPQARVSAINDASYRLLQDLQVWSQLDDARITPILSMGIDTPFDLTHGLRFDAAEFGFSELGFIVENDFLIHALLEQFKLQGGAFFCPYRATHLMRMQQQWQLQLSGQDSLSLTATLLVIAQGAQANLRELLKVSSTVEFYHQKALVVNVASDLPHRFTAYQRFFTDGPLAFLPLFKPHWSSIVWTLPTAVADDYLRGDPSQLLQQLNAVFPDLGALALLTAPRAFELTASAAEQYYGAGFVLVGDAAHTVHPLAGQGVNMGLYDVVKLCGLLQQEQDLLDVRVLARYAAACQLKHKTLSLSFSILNRLFQVRQPRFVRILSSGLRRLNHVHGLKRQLIQVARGDSWTP
jgi:ubiquinone biosynthesis UbiH/UbiF/VisC/COQ6 family hydroxylase